MRRQIGHIAGGTIVEHHHGVAARQEIFGYMGTNKSCATCNKPFSCSARVCPLRCTQGHIAALGKGPEATPTPFVTFRQGALSHYKALAARKQPFNIAITTLKRCNIKNLLYCSEVYKGTPCLKPPPLCSPAKPVEYKVMPESFAANASRPPANTCRSSPWTRRRRQRQYLALCQTHPHPFLCRLPRRNAGERRDPWQSPARHRRTPGKLETINERLSGKCSGCKAAPKRVMTASMVASMSGRAVLPRLSTPSPVCWHVETRNDASAKVDVLFTAASTAAMMAADEIQDHLVHCSGRWIAVSASTAATAKALNLGPIEQRISDLEGSLAAVGGQDRSQARRFQSGGEPLRSSQKLSWRVSRQKSTSSKPPPRKRAAATVKRCYSNWPWILTPWKSQQLRSVVVEIPEPAPEPARPPNRHRRRRAGATVALGAGGFAGYLHELNDRQISSTV